MTLQERRQAEDRRGNGRQGKYDRRKNRCGQCHFFRSHAAESGDIGHCQKHNKPIATHAFACTEFKPIL